jgi:hypothetical protein
MTDESFVRRYRIAVLCDALAWRLVLFNPIGARGAYDAIEGLVYGVGLGMLPAAALAVLAARLRSRGALVAGALAALGIEVAAFATAGASSSSTVVVALMIAPMLEVITLIPATIFLARLTAARRSG